VAAVAGLAVLIMAALKSVSLRRYHRGLRR
jgi:hypothetical protein